MVCVCVCVCVCVLVCMLVFQGRVWAVHSCCDVEMGVSSWSGLCECPLCFRCHAEFQLHEPPEMPFWFTPAQFAGRLVISRDFSHIAMFEMELPTLKTLNIGVLCVCAPVRACMCMHAFLCTCMFDVCCVDVSVRVRV